MSAFNELLYGSEACERSENSFMFLFSGGIGPDGDGDNESPRRYGACVVFPHLRFASGYDDDSTWSGSDGCNEAAAAAAEEAAAAAGESSLESISFDDLDVDLGDDSDDNDDGGGHGERLMRRRTGSGIGGDTVGSGGGYGGGSIGTLRDNAAVGPARRLSFDRGDTVGGGSCGETGSGGGDCVMQRCYCILSQQPLLELHFKVLWDLLAAERVIRVQAVADAAHRRGGPLSVSDISTAIAATSGQRLRLLRRAARRYLAVRLPAPGSRMRFTVYRTLPEISYLRPLTSREGSANLSCGSSSTVAGFSGGSGSSGGSSLRWGALPSFAARECDMLEAVAPWALPPVLSWVPPPILLQALAALLAEVQVVVSGSDLGLVSATVLALAALLRPVPWLGPLVPLLPLSMTGVLDAPVPFLLGIPASGLGGGGSGGGGDGGERSPLDLREGQLLLDLDRRELMVGGERAASLARATAGSVTLLPFPGAAQLEERLAPLVAALHPDARNGGGVDGFGFGTRHNNGASGAFGSPERPLYSVNSRQTAAVEVYRATIEDAVSSLCREAHLHWDVIKHAHATAGELVGDKRGASSSSGGRGGGGRGGGDGKGGVSGGSGGASDSRSFAGEGPSSGVGTFAWSAPEGTPVQELEWLRRSSHRVGFFRALAESQGFHILRQHCLLRPL
ncbi:unnamed protein product [Phaeothamnion confervicola]